VFLYLSYENQGRSTSHSYGVIGTYGCQLREEAAITCNAAHREPHVQERLEAVLAAFREMLDAFVSNRMRRAAAQAGHIRPQCPRDAQSQSISAQ
jgi:hypothetical protein